MWSSCVMQLEQQQYTARLQTTTSLLSLSFSCWQWPRTEGYSVCWWCFNVNARPWWPQLCVPAAWTLTHSLTHDDKSINGRQLAEATSNHLATPNGKNAALCVRAQCQTVLFARTLLALALFSSHFLFLTWQSLCLSVWTCVRVCVCLQCVRLSLAHGDVSHLGNCDH